MHVWIYAATLAQYGNAIDVLQTCCTANLTSPYHVCQKVSMAYSSQMLLLLKKH